MVSASIIVTITIVSTSNAANKINIVMACDVLIRAQRKNVRRERSAYKEFAFFQVVRKILNAPKNKFVSRIHVFLKISVQLKQNRGNKLCAVTL